MPAFLQEETRPAGTSKTDVKNVQPIGRRAFKARDTRPILDMLFTTDVTVAGPPGSQGYPAHEEASKTRWPKNDRLIENSTGNEAGLQPFSCPDPAPPSEHGYCALSEAYLRR